MNDEDNRSEVARLMQQIDLECQAMRWALHGLAAGTAQHEFIRARLNMAGSYQEQLVPHVGEQQAVEMLCQAYNAVMDAPQEPAAPIELLQNAGMPVTNKQGKP